MNLTQELLDISAQHRARLDVMHVLLTTLVIHHPDHKALWANLEKATPDLGDAVLDNFQKLPQYQAEFQRSMGEWSNLLRALAMHSGQG